MNLLVLGPKASKRQKGLEPSPQEVGACALHNGTHPTAAAGSRARSKGARRRERSLKGTAAPKLPHKHTGRDCAGSQLCSKAGELPGRSERTHAIGVGGMCGFGPPTFPSVRRANPQAQSPDPKPPHQCRSSALTRRPLFPAST